MPVAAVNGIEIAYDVHGEGEPIILVCGTGQRADSWSFLGMVGGPVDQGYQVITFDNRGMAPSGCPTGPYTVEMMAQDTIGLIEHLGLSGVRIAGISLGGFITFQVARSRPDLVRAAVCIAGLVGGSRYVQMLTDARVDAIREGRDMPAALDALLSLPGTFAPATVQNDAVVEVMTSLMGSEATEWSGPGRRGQYEADTNWIRRPSQWQEQALAETTVPVLVMAHQFDLFFPPSLLAWGAERLPAGRFLEISGCGHAGVEEIEAHREAAMAFFAEV
ncbi:MAG TPA: alpha/beta hydrolase [Acidimicrobiales bacterium]|nr:alpha/beta hydrolase [Acidimicrobiales bacterium]